MSIITGPGLPVVAIIKAFLNVSAIDSRSLIRKLCLHIGLVIPVASASWKASLPTYCLDTCPEITIIGIESICAVAIPVTQFVIPGPEVTKTTPGLLHALAYPSAACVAPCSCLTKTCLIFSAANNAS